eukprot:scaffold143499_cov21-Tisochrysis_lutea.AAC.1
MHARTQARGAIIPAHAACASPYAHLIGFSPLQGIAAAEEALAQLMGALEGHGTHHQDHPPHSPPHNQHHQHSPPSLDSPEPEFAPHGYGFRGRGGLWARGRG